jgi:hypothetical protein
MVARRRVVIVRRRGWDTVGLVVAVVVVGVIRVRDQIRDAVVIVGVAWKMQVAVIGVAVVFVIVDRRCVCAVVVVVVFGRVPG